MVKRLHGVFEDSDFARLKSAKETAGNKAGHKLNWEEFILDSVFKE